jgi:biopolymer transport protein ExbB
MSTEHIANTVTPSLSAKAFDQIDTSQLQHLIEVGGPVIAILAVMSLISLSIFLLKGWQFIWSSKGQQKALSKSLHCWHTKNPDLALTLLNNTHSPIARVLEAAITLKSRSGGDDSLIREEVMRIAKRQIANARAYLRILEVIATLSPLLGLLGTVLGMIEAFKKLQGAGSAIDPALLSGGIWEALLTTAAGLIVAIPTVIGLNWLEQRVENIKLTMEDSMTQIFTMPLQKINNVDTLKPQHTQGSLLTKQTGDTPLRATPSHS